MISVEKIENTLQISKRKHCFVDFTPLKNSRGLSSGNLEIFKTESELCIRPGSPDRYKSVSDSQGLTPSTKVSVPQDNISNSSIGDYFDRKNDQTPIKDLSLFLELDIEEVPDIDTSFFSSENGEKALEIFKTRKNDQDTFNSFASTNSKTEKLFEEFRKNIKESQNEENQTTKSPKKGKYRNNCKVQCPRCKNEIMTDVELRYPSDSL